jgi:hypothetical protein
MGRFTVTLNTCAIIHACPSRMKYCHGKCRLDFDLAYALSSHCDDTQHLVNLVALPVVFSLMFPIPV